MPGQELAGTMKPKVSRQEGPVPLIANASLVITRTTKGIHP